jgi:hypothetical protein
MKPSPVPPATLGTRYQYPSSTPHVGQHRATGAEVRRLLDVFLHDVVLQVCIEIWFLHQYTILRKHGGLPP